MPLMREADIIAYRKRMRYDEHDEKNLVKPDEDKGATFMKVRVVAVRSQFEGMRYLVDKLKDAKMRKKINTSLDLLEKEIFHG